MNRTRGLLAALAIAVVTVVAGVVYAEGGFPGIPDYALQVDSSHPHQEKVIPGSNGGQKITLDMGDLPTPEGQ